MTLRDQPATSSATFAAISSPQTGRINRDGGGSPATAPHVPLFRPDALVSPLLADTGGRGTTAAALPKRSNDISTLTDTPARHMLTPSPQVASIPMQSAAAPTPPAHKPPLAPLRLSPPVAAPPARRLPRQFKLAASFTILVLLPVLFAAWYLWFKAQDQYASTLGFSVHRENSASGLTMLSGLSSLTGVSGSSDTDIIYHYIFSQQVVREIQADLDLVSMWSKTANDPYFGYDPTGSLEDLVDYWGNMVNVYYDNATRLIEVRALAFAPEDAQRITEEIFQKAGDMINRLNQIAAEDTVRFTREELEQTRDKLLASRQEMTAFRNKYQLVDPASDLASQSAIVISLEQSLAEAMIATDMLKQTAPETDPRLAELERRRRVIQERLDAERGKIGAGAGALNDQSMAEVFAEWERLTVDREFAEASYNAARATYESARAQALRQTRYLAPHIYPTKAETSRFPERGKTLATLSVFLVMLWSVMALVYYSLRDRR